MAPKVSVVTCSYNRPELLRKAVESMRAQTDSDWEHLILDDGSTNRDVRAVLEWAAEDSRTKVWASRSNHDRPAMNWNFLLDRALGKYFTVLDDDNEKLPTFVAAMSRELDRDNTLDVVTCGWRVVRDGLPPVDSHLNLSTTPQELAHLSTCDGGAMLYRRSAFERAGYFSEAIRTSEDWDWLRRAAGLGRVKNLLAVHATYRGYGARRMDRAQSLGCVADGMTVTRRQIAPIFGVELYFPQSERLTQSQKDVCESVERATYQIPWVSRGRDLNIVVAPFQMTEEETAAVSRRGRVLSLHMEDPYALAQNLEHVRRMALSAETWVCTNDVAAVPYYRRLVNDRVIICPLLSADGKTAMAEDERDIDVLFCGYAYPSRKRLMQNLLPQLAGLRVVLVGDGWEGFGVETLPTQMLPETRALHARARAVVCAHRDGGDCADGPVKPATVNRGFLEGFYGPRVFLDRSRGAHSIDDGDVVWYDDAADLATKLRGYLTNPDGGAEKFAEKCRIFYTFQTRLARIINCVRSPRFLAEIP